MSRWLRLYADAMRNPKVMRLADKDFRLWVKLLCVASENEGAIPALDDLKLVLGMRLDHLSTGLDRLISGRMIDVLGDGYAPHSWAKFQYKSDTSNERVAKHRAARNVTVTPPETEADTDTEKKERVPATPTLSARERAQPVFDEWNGMAKERGLPLASKLDAKRIASITGRLIEHDRAVFTEAIRKIGASEFCRGSNFASLDWLTKPANFLKVIEGNYDDRLRNGNSMGGNRIPPTGNVRTVAALDLVRQYGTAAQRDQSGDCGPDRQPRVAVSAGAR